MKNNKGFAITSYLYIILILFLVIFSVTLLNIINSELKLQKVKKEVKNKIEESIILEDYAQLIISPKIVQINSGTDIDLLEGVYLEKYDKSNLDSNITYTSDPEFSNTILGTYVITYQTIYNNITYTNNRTVIVN